MIKCQKCGGLNKITFNLKFSVMDAIGYTLLCIVLALPFWLLTELYLLLDEYLGFFILIVSALFSYKNKAYFLAIFFIFIAISKPFSLFSKVLSYFIPLSTMDLENILAIVAFLLAYFMVSNKIYRYLAMLVDYKFQATIQCLSCGHIKHTIKLPTHQE